MRLELRTWRDTYKKAGEREGEREREREMRYETCSTADVEVSGKTYTLHSNMVKIKRSQKKVHGKCHSLVLCMSVMLTS